MPLEHVDYFITDADLNEEYRDAFDASGVHYTYVK